MEKDAFQGSSTKKAEQSDESKDDSITNPPKKRKTEKNQKNLILPPMAINIIAESMGINDLPENVLSGLAEDATFRLRELISNCAVLLKNQRRRKLLTEDVNRVLETSDSGRIYGHSGPEECGFQFVENIGVYVQNDHEVDVVSLALNESTFHQSKTQSVTARKVVLDPLESRKEKKTHSQEPGPSTNPGNSGESTSTTQPETPNNSAKSRETYKTHTQDLLNYYIQIARSVLGGSTPLLQVALSDLKTNPRIGPILPYLFNLIALSINRMQRHHWLTNALLSTAEAIHENPYVNPCSYVSARRTMNSILVVAIEPKVAKYCDDLLLRKRAARLLSKVLPTWSTEMKFQTDMVKQLMQLLLDKKISVQTQYGAIFSLICLGHYTLNSYFWPVIAKFISISEGRRNSSVILPQVMGTILLAAEKTYRNEWLSEASVEDWKRRHKVDQMLCDYFGDALVPIRQDFSRKDPLYSKTSNSVNNSEEDHAPYDTPKTPSIQIQTTPIQVPKKRLINFNFKHSRQIETKNRHNLVSFQMLPYQKSLHKFPTIWNEQKLIKKTRTIKYCGKSHFKSSAGDLFITI